MTAFSAFKTLRIAAVVVVTMSLPSLATSASVTQKEYEAALRSTPDLANGQALFAICNACHGTDGPGDSNAPLLAGQHFRVIVHELVDYRHDRRWDPRMENTAGEHRLGSTQDIADVAAYISNQLPQRTVDIGDGTLVEHGGDIYARLCASCHGPSAKGNNRELYPRLAGQRFSYLLRQMHDAVEGRRPNFSLDHIRLLQHFDRDDFVGISDYLSHLNP